MSIKATHSNCRHHPTQLCCLLLPLVAILGVLLGFPQSPSGIPRSADANAADRGPQPGDPLPLLQLTDASGTPVAERLPDGTDHGGGVQLLLFVRAQQHYSEQALVCCERVVESSGNAVLRRVWVGNQPEEVPEKWRSKSWYDTQRKTVGPLEIIVHPYTIVVDAQKKVVTTLASFPPRYETQLKNALLLASGKIDRAEFERRTSSPHDSNTKESTGNRARLICNLAKQLATRQQHAKAEAEYKRALSIAPQDTFVIASYASYLIARGKADEARAQLLALSEPDRASPPVQLLRARLLIADNQPKQALDILETLVDQLPEKETLWLEMGRAHELLENWQEAATCYRKGLEAALQRE